MPMPPRENSRRRVRAAEGDADAQGSSGGGGGGGTPTASSGLSPNGRAAMSDEEMMLKMMEDAEETVAQGEAARSAAAVAAAAAEAAKPKLQRARESVGEIKLPLLLRQGSSNAGAQAMLAELKKKHKQKKGKAAEDGDDEEDEDDEDEDGPATKSVIWGMKSGKKKAKGSSEAVEDYWTKKDKARKRQGGLFGRLFRKPLPPPDPALTRKRWAGALKSARHGVLLRGMDDLPSQPSFKARQLAAPLGPGTCKLEFRDPEPRGPTLYGEVRSGVGGGARQPGERRGLANGRGEGWQHTSSGYHGSRPLARQPASCENAVVNNRPSCVV